MRPRTGRAEGMTAEDVISVAGLTVDLDVVYQRMGAEARYSDDGRLIHDRGLKYLLADMLELEADHRTPAQPLRDVRREVAKALRIRGWVAEVARNGGRYELLRPVDSAAGANVRSGVAGTEGGACRSASDQTATRRSARRVTASRPTAPHRDRTATLHAPGDPDGALEPAREGSERAVGTAGPDAVDALGAWSEWMPLATACVQAPRLPGVYIGPTRTRGPGDLCGHGRRALRPGQ